MAIIYHFAPMIVSLHSSSLDSAPAAPLTAAEKSRLGQLIRTIERGLSTFLEVSTCLQEIRSSRLYRGTHADFQSWCRETLGLARSSVDGLIRSGEVAQLLTANGVELPPSTTEAVIRPLASLPEVLQPVSWQLVEAVSPKCGPTQPVVAKVVRIIKNALQPKGSNGNGHKPRRRDHPPREIAFVAPIQRLSAYRGFDAALVTAHVDTLASARSIVTACRTMTVRCQEVESVLLQRFPEINHA